LNIDEIGCHFRANGFAGREEKIGNINLAFIVFLGDGFAGLIGKRKIGNRVVFADVLHRSVHQFWVYVGWIVNWKRFFWFQCGIKQGNYNDGKDQQDTKEFSILIEKGLHK
jgi:hypothetical protein